MNHSISFILVLFQYSFIWPFRPIISVSWSKVQNCPWPYIYWTSPWLFIINGTL